MMIKVTQSSWIYFTDDLQWFKFSPCHGNAKVYFRVCQYTVAPLFGVVREQPHPPAVLGLGVAVYMVVLLTETAAQVEEH